MTRICDHDADLSALANDLSAERDRLRALRAELLERLDGQSNQGSRSVGATKPPGADTLTEDDWWAKVLGRGMTAA